MTTIHSNLAQIDADARDLVRTLERMTITQGEAIKALRIVAAVDSMRRVLGAPEGAGRAAA